MITISKNELCSGCHACENICSKNCIHMLSDEEGFWYPRVDTNHCIDCGKCEKICPIIHKLQPDVTRFTEAIAAINKNDKIRLKSSSGGIFTLIAEEIIRQGGIVFGASFTDDFKSVKHIGVDNSIDLEKLRGSKYVQSKIGDTYQQAKNFLERGRKVLFTGTPCQIGGLYSYLRKKYDNLYTQDIICHGVPSPMVWEKYINEREYDAASKVKRMFFRDKRYGWKTYALIFEFSNNKAYIKNHREDYFMTAFLTNSCLRPSCYSCSFKGVQRQADITLADFWGIRKILPRMDDDKGTSLVLIHSNHGKLLFNKIINKCIIKKVPIECVEKYNPSVSHSVELNPIRNSFMNDVVNNRFNNVIQKYYK